MLIVTKTVVRWPSISVFALKIKNKGTVYRSVYQALTLDNSSEHNG